MTRERVKKLDKKRDGEKNTSTKTCHVESQIERGSAVMRFCIFAGGAGGDMIQGEDGRQ